MLHSLSENIADFLLSKESFDKEQLAVYVYGTELVLASILNLAILVLICLIFNCIAQGILLYASFISLRHYTGGLHCKTHLRCALTFSAVCLACLAGARFASLTPHKTSVLIAMAAVSTVIIAALSPVENENKRLSDSEKVKYRRIAIIVFSIHMAVCIALAMLGLPYEIIIVTDFAVALSIPAGLHNITP